MQQRFADVIAADFLEIAIAEAEVPPRVDELGQRFPIPFALVFSFRQVFFESVVQLRFDLPQRFIAGQSLGGVAVQAAEVAGFQFHAQNSARHLA